jgi:hypothetical protein
VALAKCGYKETDRGQGEYVQRSVHLCESLYGDFRTMNGFGSTGANRKKTVKKEEEKTRRADGARGRCED